METSKEPVHVRLLFAGLAVVLVIGTAYLLHLSLSRSSSAVSQNRDLKTAVGQLATQVTNLGGTPHVTVSLPPGVPGHNGINGQPGQTGAVGARGPSGRRGRTGKTGATGKTGQRGATGQTGAQGIQGAQGPAGATGADGQTGPQGAQGPQGDTGPMGPTGPAGDSGCTFILDPDPLDAGNYICTSPAPSPTP